jgi:hypothetical protein
MKAIPDDHVAKVCKPGKKDCCRYLTMSGKGWECAKLTSFKSLLDDRVKAGTIRAIGDNCEGKP